MKSPHTLPAEADLLGLLLLGSLSRELVTCNAAVDKTEYSKASELDADNWDEEFRLNQRIARHNAQLRTELAQEEDRLAGDPDAHLGAVEDDVEMLRRLR